MIMKDLTSIFDNFSPWKIDYSPILISLKMRIVSFNVHYFTTRDETPSFPSILDDILQLDPDIVCLQEVSFIPQVSQLKEAFPFYVSNILCNYRGYPFGNMLLSKTKMTNEKSGKLYKGATKIPRGYILCEVGGINIATVHLDVFDENIPSRKQKVLVRHIQVQELLAMLPPKCILCGDFNTILASDYSKQRLGEIQEIDTKRGVVTDMDTIPLVLGDGFERVGGVPEKTVWSERVVDFFFARGIAVKSGGVLETDSSDHYAIYIDL